MPILWKSNGFVTAEALEVLAPCLAAANLDLKAASESDHRRLTGAPLRPVLDTLTLLHALGVWVEVSTPLIPGFNDDAATLGAIAGQVAALGAGVPWHLVRFLPDYRRAHVPPTSPERLAQAGEIGRRQGLHHVYVERGLGDAGRRTDCPDCGAAVIERDLWRLRENRLDNGRCPECGGVLSGVWQSLGGQQ